MPPNHFKTIESLIEIEVEAEKIAKFRNAQKITQEESALIGIAEEQKQTQNKSKCDKRNLMSFIPIGTYCCLQQLKEYLNL